MYIDFYCPIGTVENQPFSFIKRSSDKLHVCFPNIDGDHSLNGFKLG